MTSRLCRIAPVSIVTLTMGVTETHFASPKYALGVRLRRVIFELGVLTQEGQLHIAVGPLRCFAMMMSAMPCASC